MDDRPPASRAELERLDAVIETWLGSALSQNPLVDAVERAAGERRWFVRVRGDVKDLYTIRFDLGQRTLHYETFVLPAPEENHAAFHEQLLRRNLDLYGLSFAIGEEDAVFLVGQLGVGSIDHGELDRVLGTVYATVERCFRPALRVGFASRFGT